MSVRAAARGLARARALDVLSLTSRISGPPPQGSVQFLYLHDVPRSTISRFDELVRHLGRTYELVSYSEAVSRLAEGTGTGRAALCFSFDDAFVSNLEAAAVLDSHGVSACFFVPTDFIGCPDVDSARRFFGMAAGVDEPAMTWSDLEGLAGRGHEIGNHTATHRVLSTLSTDEVEEEISGARETLVSRLGRCDHFAWPRGQFQHFTAHAATVTFGSGHTTCASAVRGSHRAGEGLGRDTCIRRDHLVTAWPLRHQYHFVRSSGRNPARDWPEDWRRR